MGETGRADFLVVGASGQVGGFLCSELQARGESFAGTYNSYATPGMLPLDVRDAGAVAEVFGRVAPRVVLLPASLTHVDHCEQHPDDAYAANVAGAAHVARHAAESGARLVYFSSDYVFDGLAGPYREDAVARPLNVYGWQKLAAEHFVATNVPDALIVRTTVVYGREPQGKNFVARLVQTLGQGGRMRVPDDQVGSPTYAPDLAGAVLDLVAAGRSGVLNVAGRERASRYDFAVAAARAFGVDERLLDPVPTSALAQPARRPLDAGLDVARAERLLGRALTGYVEGLRRVAMEAPRT